jgi:hypothetical protein
MSASIVPHLGSESLEITNLMPAAIDHLDESEQLEGIRAEWHRENERNIYSPGHVKALLAGIRYEQPKYEDLLKACSGYLVDIALDYSEHPLLAYGTAQLAVLDEVRRIDLRNSSSKIFNSLIDAAIESIVSNREAELITALGLVCIKPELNTDDNDVGAVFEFEPVTEPEIKKEVIQPTTTSTKQSTRLKTTRYSATSQRQGPWFPLDVMSKPLTSTEITALAKGKPDLKVVEQEQSKSHNSVYSDLLPANRSPESFEEGQTLLYLHKGTLVKAEVKSVTATPDSLASQGILYLIFNDGKRTDSVVIDMNRNTVISTAAWHYMNIDDEFKDSWLEDCTIECLREVDSLRNAITKLSTTNSFDYDSSKIPQVVKLEPIQDLQEDVALAS